MSYDIYLSNAGDVEGFQAGSILEAKVDEDGKLVPVNSTTPHMNITYNYGKFYYESIDNELGIRWLYGKTGADTVQRLYEAVNHLGIDQSDDYWEATPGNAGYALLILLDWARKYPEGIWEGD